MSGWSGTPTSVLKSTRGTNRTASLNRVPHSNMTSYAIYPKPMRITNCLGTLSLQTCGMWDGVILQRWWHTQSELHIICGHSAAPLDVPVDDWRCRVTHIQ
ncbi:hypothetical protein AcV7_006803 [Taiwanofungus camphoratus]|nr:hypothetical protein AcV7_006803 [Antrodia cinnamomea]